MPEKARAFYQSSFFSYSFSYYQEGATWGDLAAVALVAVLAAAGDLAADSEDLAVDQAAVVEQAGDFKTEVSILTLYLLR